MKYPLSRRQRRKLKFDIENSPFTGFPRIQRMHRKVGRNDLCPCGSGKKFKHCVECFKKYGESRQYFTDEDINEAIKNFKG